MKRVFIAFLFLIFVFPQSIFAEPVDYKFFYDNEVTSVGNYQEGLMVFSEDDLFGYMDVDGKTVIKQQYEYAFYFNEGLAVVAKGEGQWGYINKKGEEVIPCIYQSAFDYKEGLCSVKKDELFGYLDANNNIVIPFVYDWAGEFNDGLAPVILDGQQYFINKKGEIVIEKPLINKALIGDIYEQDDIIYWIFDDYFNEGLAPASIAVAEKDSIAAHNRLTFIDKTGKIVIATRPYDNMSMDIYFKDERALVKSENGFGYLDKTGAEIIPCQFEDARDFYEGYAAVMMDGKWGFIDKNGILKIPFEYDEAYDFSEGLACIGKDGKNGFIDKKNNLVIEPVFNFALDFREGLTWTVANEVNGVIKNPLVRVYINGEYLGFEQNPIIENERVLVPMRAVFNALGAEVEWNDSNKNITAKKGSTIINLTIGKNNMSVNDREISLDTEPIIVNDRTFVPIRAISEAFKAEVDWNQKERKVEITLN